MIVLFLAGLHVASALGLIGMTVMYLFSDRPLWDMLGQIAWNVNSSSVLVAIPLFVMMGEVLIHSRLSERLYEVLSHWLAPLPGGILHSNIAFCAVFGAISGSSAACAATVGAVALPAFRARNYNERLVIGSLAAGGTLDILIPPSISMIIYGVLAEESIGRLYLAGFIPGFMLAGIFMLIIAVAAKIWPSVAPREAPPSWRVRLRGAALAAARHRPDVRRAGHDLPGDRHAHRGGGLRGGGQPHPGRAEPAGQRAPCSSRSWSRRCARRP